MLGMIPTAKPGGQNWHLSRTAASRSSPYHDNLPPGLSAADNETGWRMSLDKLAAEIKRAVRQWAGVRRGRKKARRSSASNSGSSIAAKCPPRDISVQRWILKNR